MGTIECSDTQRNGDREMNRLRAHLQHHASGPVRVSSIRLRLPLSYRFLSRPSHVRLLSSCGGGADRGNRIGDPSATILAIDVCIRRDLLWFVNAIMMKSIGLAELSGTA
jgi:hypothetical protein